MEFGLDISQVVEPPPGHGLESQGGVLDVREVLRADRAVPGG